MKFKVGDTVQIRKWEDMIQEFGVKSYNGFSVIEVNKSGLVFNWTMNEYCGKIITLDSINEYGYFNTKGCLWNFSPEMFVTKNLYIGKRLKFKSYKTLRTYIYKNKKFDKWGIYGISWKIVKEIIEKNPVVTIKTLENELIGIEEVGYYLPIECFKEVKNEK